MINRDKILVIISTGEVAKALTGAMYAVNTLKHGWMAEVKLVLFGPAEKLLLEDPDLQEWVRTFQSLEGEPVACRYLAEGEGMVEDLEKLGVGVAYVGPRISEWIQSGYLPMIW